MIITPARSNHLMGVALQQIYKTNNTPSVARAGKADVVDISCFAAAIDKARRTIDCLPSVRNELVLQTRLELLEGSRPRAADTASAMINRASRGEA